LAIDRGNKVAQTAAHFAAAPHRSDYWIEIDVQCGRIKLSESIFLGVDFRCDVADWPEEAIRQRLLAYDETPKVMQVEPKFEAI